MLPDLVLRDRVTPLLLAKDMYNKLHEGHNHVGWFNNRNPRRRQWNGLDIVVLPQNLLRQVTTHPVFVGHDTSGVPTYVLKRCHVSSSLVRPPDDMSMLHRINCGYEVFRIRKFPGRFPFTPKRVNMQVIFLTLPRNECLEVRKNPSLQTHRNGTNLYQHKYHTNNYTFMIH
jgi:hypothetical protein